ncbi:MAG: C10 family peptidase [Bacteroidaceae bacterium]|nr:C10 family peptidase [Bacteroidaceae bacterium]
MKRNLSTLFLLLLAVQMVAGPVSRQDAMKAAQQFLGKRGVKAPALKEKMRAPMKGEASAEDISAYYIFNVGDNGGFVVVSGDDRTDAVLGYTLSGDFDEATMPENMRAWLQSYADQISALNADERALGYNPRYIEGGSQEDTYEPLTSSVPFHDAVSPLIKTQWNQDSPYNAKCPKVGATNCYTGCIATAMAQVMNYFQYPASFPAIAAYTTTLSPQPISVEALPGLSDFAWGSLKETYSPDDIDDNIAYLMRYCGQSVKMSYGTASSSTYEAYVPTALKSIFGYKSANFVDRSQYSSKGWDELIYTELANNRPVIYNGQSSGGGHEFVCDGYDGYGYYHINWGWGGYQDGYFLLSALNPDEGGIGASSTSDGYVLKQNAVVNIKTTEASPEILKAILYEFTYNEDTSKLVVAYYNVTGKDYKFDLGLAYMDGDEIKHCYTALSGYPLNYTYYVRPEVSLSKFSSLPDGVYRIVPVSRVSGTETWYRCSDNEEICAEISVSGGGVTFVTMHPIEDFTASIDDPTCTLYANSLNKISASFTNNGPDVLEKKLKLYFYAPNSMGPYEDTKVVSQSAISVPVGETKTVQLEFRPIYGKGTYKLQVRDYNDINVIYCSKDVTVASPPTEEYVNTVSNPRFVGGASPRFEVDITNKNDFEQPARPVGVVVCYTDTLISGYYMSVPVVFNVDVIPAGATVTASCNLSSFRQSDWADFFIGSNPYLYLFDDISQSTYAYFDIRDTKDARFYIAQPSGFGYASYAKDVALDFSECEGLTAYTGTLKKDGDLQVLQMTAHTQVPANTGLVLKGEPHVKYAVRRIDSAPAITDNDLVAATSDKTVAANSILVLGCVNQEVAFYNYEGKTIEAGHSYLPKTKTGDVSKVEVVWDEPSGISNARTEYDTVPTATFNIAGQRVDESYKGIVIKNGKKLIAK